MRVLFIGETWITHTVHIKGVDSFEQSGFGCGVGWIKKALESGGHEVTHLPAHQAIDAFPDEQQLTQYDVVICSDVGSNTLVLSTPTMVDSRTRPNALESIRRFVAAGGGFAYVVKPTFGFLLGFIMAAFVSGLLVQKLSRRAGENPSSKSYHRDLPRYFIAALGGLVVTYGFGIFYMYVANNFFLGAKVPLWAVFVSCFPIDIPCDLGLCVIAALLGPRLCALVKKEL